MISEGSFKIHRLDFRTNNVQTWAMLNSVPTSVLKINEVFYSIQGESSWVGHPTVFVRTTGCNLRCTYCDTKYSHYEPKFFYVIEFAF